MSTYYTFYTEALVDKAWHCIDPKFLHLERRGEDQIYRLSPTYWNGSRSYFSEAYDKLVEVSTCIRFPELSEELRVCKREDWRGDESEIEPYYNSLLRAVPLAKLRDLYESAKKYENYGIYRKNDIVLFEDGTLESLWEREIDPADYSALADEAKKLFQYYEWNDAMSWRSKIPDLYNLVTGRVREFESENYLEYEDVRVIMYAD